jgi:predicted transcriptional regulator
MASKAKQIESQRGKPIAEIVIELLSEYGDQAKVAQILGVSQSSISLWLAKSGYKSKGRNYQQVFQSPHTGMIVQVNEGGTYHEG